MQRDPCGGKYHYSLESWSSDSGVDPFFGWGGGGAKCEKFLNISGRSARKVAISNFSGVARRKKLKMCMFSGICMLNLMVL